MRVALVRVTLSFEAEKVATAMNPLRGQESKTTQLMLS